MAAVQVGPASGHPGPARPRSACRLEITPGYSAAVFGPRLPLPRPCCRGTWRLGASRPATLNFDKAHNAAAEEEVSMATGAN